jgi:hypothetical protein
MMGSSVAGVFLLGTFQHVPVANRGHRVFGISAVQCWWSHVRRCRDVLHRAVGGLDSSDTGFVIALHGCSGHLDHSAAHGSDGLQQAWTHLCPPDQQQWADGVERGLPDLASDERIGDVERQGDDAGEDQEAAGWPELIRRCAVEGEMAGTQQEAQDRQVHGWGYKRRDPGRDA